MVLTVAKKNSSFLFDEFYQDIEYSKNDLEFGTITSEMIMQSYYIRNLFSLTAFQLKKISFCKPEERMYKENIASTKSRL